MGTTEAELDANGRPGDDIDPEGRVKGYIKLGWTLVGAFFTIGFAAIILKRFGLISIPENPTAMDCARITAFAVAVLNIGAWMYFPLADLEIQRRWIRSSGSIFPGGTTEFFMILLTLVLLLITIVTSLISPMALAIAGIGVYLWNFFGYAYMRNEIKRVIRESHDLYSDQSEPGRTALMNGLAVVQNHFAVTEDAHPVRNHQQIRHCLIVFGFVLSAALAGIGIASSQPIFSILSYYWSACVFLASEVSIGIWRSRRDRKLRFIEEDWRRARRQANRPARD